MTIKETCVCGATLEITDDSKYAINHLGYLQEQFLSDHRIHSHNEIPIYKMINKGY